MTFKLGTDVDSLEVRLHRDSEFTSSLVLDDNWPPSTVVTLRFSPQDGTPDAVWTATVTGTTATFNATKAEVAARPHHEWVELWLNELTWARGRVERYGHPPA